MTIPSLFIRNRSFLTVWGGEAISELGGSFGTVVNVWLVFQLTGSQASLGGMWLIYFLPSLLVQLVAGPYLDRWNRRWVMILSQWIRAVAFLVPLTMLLQGRTEIWPLYLVSLVNGLIQPLYVPASLAFLPSIVDKSQLPTANAVLDGTMRLLLVIAPPLAGLLLASWGETGIMALICAAYLLSGLLLFFCQDDDRKRENPREGWTSQFLAGLTYFRRQRVLVWLGIFLSFVQLAVGASMVLNPAYVADELNGNSVHYGLFMAGFPFGYFIGTLLIGLFPALIGRRIVMLGSLFAGGLTFIALAFFEQIVWAIATEIVAGIAAPFFHVYSTSLTQRMVPNELLGRVLSVRLLIIRTSMPLGLLLGSIGGEAWGVRPVYVLIGGIICITSLVGILLPAFSFLEQPKEKCEHYGRL